VNFACVRAQSASYLGTKLLKVMRTSRRIHWTLLNCIVVCLVLLVLMTPAVVQSASAIAKGYTTDDTGLQPGMVAALSESGSAEEPIVKRASQDAKDKIIGITTTAEEELLTIASGEKQAYVQISGEVSAYVSDINGTVKNGDLLAVSPIRGILMKTGENPSTIVGIALEDFNESTAETKSIDSGNGKKDVKVVKVKVNLDHKAASNQQSNTMESYLQQLGQSVTGRSVGEIRVAAALVIFLIVLVAEGGIIYGAISSALVALGRNPMARKIIRSEMVRVILIAFAVLGIGVGAIYGILWI